MAHVAQYKKDIVKKVIDLCGKYPIIGILNMENLPTAQLQTMKEKLRGKCEIFMTKKRLFKIAIEDAAKSKKGLEKVIEKFQGMPALIFTSDNPFSLFKILKQNKSEAPAKPGQIAPKDIEIKAGPTPFPPGPVISELGALGLKTKVEDGKVTILEDTVVCKEGDEVSGPLSSMLLRLDIKPMEIGLNIVSVFENGELLDSKVLDIDEDKFNADLASAISGAFNLSIEIGYPTKDNINMMVGKAFRDSKAVGLEAGILADMIKEEVLAKVEAGAKALKEEANIEVPDKKVEPKEEEKKEEVKEEPKKEEVKEEVKEPVQPTEEKKEEIKEEVDAKEEKVEEQKEEEVKEEVQQKEEVKQEKVDTQEEKKGKEEADKVIEKTEEVEKKVEEKVEKVVEVEEKVEKSVEETKEKSKKIAGKAEEILEEVSQDIEETKKATETEETKEDDKRKEVEDLAAELMKKGTLRK
tara:strand:+ start:3375 stop:4775 length:1401 start_codon:yes stop_codon:yes gene_type:complete